MDIGILITTEESMELLAYLEHQYISPNTHPLVHRLVSRLQRCSSPEHLFGRASGPVPETTSQGHSHNRPTQ